MKKEELTKLEFNYEDWQKIYIGLELLSQSKTENYMNIKRIQFKIFNEVVMKIK